MPEQPFGFKEQHDYDLHIALEVAADALASMLERGRRAGVATRGVTDHGFIRSVYFRDPNGYVIELAARVPESAPQDLEVARARLDRWQAEKLLTSASLPAG